MYPDSRHDAIRAAHTRTRAIHYPADYDPTWFEPEALITEAGFTTLYGELRAIGGYLLRGEAYTPTIQATELVNEAFLKLYGSPVSFNDRRHALAILSRYMRQILIDRARRRGAAKRQGVRVSWEDAVRDAGFDLDQWHTISEALKTLEATDDQLARVFELRYFMGLRMAEIALALECSERTAKRKWSASKAWLQDALERSS